MNPHHWRFRDHGATETECAELEAEIGPRRRRLEEVRATRRRIEAHAVEEAAKLERERAEARKAAEAAAVARAAAERIHEEKVQAQVERSKLAREEAERAREEELRRQGAAAMAAANAKLWAEEKRAAEFLGAEDTQHDSRSRSTADENYGPGK